MALLFAFSIPVMALEKEPRYVPCPECTSGKINESFEYLKWNKTYIKPCQHGFPKGHDEEYNRKINLIYKCSSCSFRQVTFYDTEYDSKCFGKDRSLLNWGE